MVNENKVKLMTKMAMYESNEGREDLKISSYYRQDYVSLQTIITVLWITLGYAIAVGIGAVLFLEKIMEKLDLTLMIVLFACLVSGWLILMIVYGFFASSFYQKKHRNARKRVKKFNHDLTRLNRKYEREKE